MAERAATEAEQRKWEAEAVKAAAEAEKALAESDKVRQEAREAAAKAQQAELSLASAQRREQEELVGDKFFNIYRFNSSVESNSVGACISQLTTWSRLKPSCSMEIIFKSPGGSVIDGMVLFDAIEDLRRQNHHITTSAMGMAASMAGILLQAGDRRVMHRECWMLIHEIAFGAIGKIGEIEDTVDWAKRIQARVLDIFANRCKLAGEAGTAKHPLTKAQIKKRWARKDWWISSDQCLDLGLVDEVR